MGFLEDIGLKVLGFYIGLYQVIMGCRGFYKVFRGLYRVISDSIRLCRGFGLM